MNNDITKIVVLLFLGVVSLWDAFTTVTGTLSVISSGGGFAMALSVLCAIFVGGLLINTIPIMTNPRDDFMALAPKGMWVICLAYDLYTAFIGNQSLVVTNDGKGIILLGFMTAITVACPISISYVLFPRRN